MMLSSVRSQQREEVAGARRAVAVAYGVLGCLIVGFVLTVSFALHNSLRTMGVSMGFSLHDFLFIAGVSVVVTAVFASIPAAIWLAVVSWKDLVRFRRVRRGLCAACGYPREGVAGPECPECGCGVGPEQLSRHILARRALLFVAVLGGAGVLGTAAAEAWILWDEHRFRGEAREWEARGGTNYFHRNRAWPNGNSELIYHTQYGFRAND